LDLPAELPPKCCLQIHWYREPNFQRFLHLHSFHIVTLRRHPLDILISVLHFIQHEPQTAVWLKGNAEIPAQLSGEAPTSDAFLEWAISWGAENLLSISYQWAHHPSAIKLSYEELVKNTGLVVRKARKRPRIAKPHFRSGGQRDHLQQLCFAC
jgi:hypothetical protein